MRGLGEGFAPLTGRILWRLMLPLLAALVLAGCEPMPVETGEPPVDTLRAVIDISDQEVVVTRRIAASGRTETYRWPVSTGRRGYDTPTGSFRPFFLSKNHRSSLYDDAPMPHSVFFNGNIAIHGTLATRALGRRASHGCVRVHPTYAALFFNMVREVGKRRTVITVQD